MKFWNSDVAELMTKRELSFTTWPNKEHDQFWIDPKYMAVNIAGFQLLSAAVHKRARTHLNTTSAMLLSILLTMLMSMLLSMLLSTL